MKRVVLFLLCAVLIVVVAAVSLNKRFGRGESSYLLPQLGDKSLSLAKQDGEGELCFRGIVQLGKDTYNSAAILELNVFTEVEADPANNVYKLVNPRLVINPIGCTQLALEKEYRTDMGISLNGHFGTESGQAFSQTMDAGVAKVLAKSSNTRIESITSLDGLTKIAPTGELRSTANETVVTVDYVNLEQYFDEWYTIQFTLSSEKEGYFTVN